MKRLLKIVIACILSLGGVASSLFCLAQLLQGNWLWFLLFVASGAVALAGVRLLQGDRLRDIVEDLLFIFVRTH